MTRVQTPQASTTATPGWVSFVGSGPGDPGLLTVRAVELLESAEVIVTEAPETAMVIFAHPDDVDFGCSGTLASWIKTAGTHVTYCVITSGQKGTHDLKTTAEEIWRDTDGRVAIAIWNGTLDQSKTDGDERRRRAPPPRCSR